MIERCSWKGRGLVRCFLITSLRMRETMPRMREVGSCINEGSKSFAERRHSFPIVASIICVYGDCLGGYDYVVSSEVKTHRTRYVQMLPAHPASSLLYVDVFIKLAPAIYVISIECLSYSLTYRREEILATVWYHILGPGSRLPDIRTSELH